MAQHPHMPERGEMRHPNPGEAFIGSNTFFPRPPPPRLHRTCTSAVHSAVRRGGAQNSVSVACACAASATTGASASLPASTVRPVDVLPLYAPHVSTERRNVMQAISWRSEGSPPPPEADAADSGGAMIASQQIVRSDSSAPDAWNDHGCASSTCSGALGDNTWMCGCVNVRGWKRQGRGFGAGEEEERSDRGVSQGRTEGGRGRGSGSGGWRERGREGRREGGNDRGRKVVSERAGRRVSECVRETVSERADRRVSKGGKQPVSAEGWSKVAGRGGDGGREQGVRARCEERGRQTDTGALLPTGSKRRGVTGG
eukprot:358284-Chlamydomonas_euryale.AAC.1